MDNADDQIKWVTLKIELPDELEAKLEKRAQEEGMSVTCYCVHAIFRHFMEGATAEQKELWERHLPATLRRNGCPDGVLTP
jgi:hypothetical protein